MSDYLETTIRYYAHWLDLSPADFNVPGVTSRPSPHRDSIQVGYSAPFKLYCLLRGRTLLISYSSSLNDVLQWVTKTLAMDCPLNERFRLLRQELPALGHGIKFFYRGLPDSVDTGETVRLDHRHYDEFLAFFMAHAPGNDPTAWLPEYYRSLVDRGYLFGLFRNGHLVSATDAPDMPYMADEVVEIGINTLKEHQGRGYAKVVVMALLKHLLQTGKTPMWSCDASNEGSAALARAVGFADFADVLYLQSR